MLCAWDYGRGGYEDARDGGMCEAGICFTLMTLSCAGESKSLSIDLHQRVLLRKSLDPLGLETTIIAELMVAQGIIGPNTSAATNEMASRPNPAR